MTSPFQPFLDQLSHDLQGVLPPEEVQATVADARAHLEDLYQNAIVQGIPKDQAVKKALSEFGKPKSLKDSYRPSPLRIKLKGPEKLAAVAIAASLFFACQYFLGYFQTIPSFVTGPFHAIVWTVTVFSMVVSSLRCRRILVPHLLIGFLAFSLLGASLQSPRYRLGPSNELILFTKPEKQSPETDKFKLAWIANMCYVIDYNGSIPPFHMTGYKTPPDVWITRRQLETLETGPSAVTIPAILVTYLPEFALIFGQVAVFHILLVLAGTGYRHIQTEMRRLRNKPPIASN